MSSYAPAPFLSGKAHGKAQEKKHENNSDNPGHILFRKMFTDCSAAAPVVHGDRNRSPSDSSSQYAHIV